MIIMFEKLELRDRKYFEIWDGLHSKIYFSYWEECDHETTSWMSWLYNVSRGLLAKRK